MSRYLLVSHCQTRSSHLFHVPAIPTTKVYPLSLVKDKSIGRTGRRNKRFICSRLSDSNPSKQQVNLSVLRFTFGIPGFDESLLPRWIGFVFGSLILLNHLSASNSPDPAQLRSEALGILLALFSITLPYLGKFLEGTTSMDRSTLPEGNRQIFLLSERLTDIQKEDLAWASFVLLRNTNTISVIISVEGSLCVRGYWNVPENVPKVTLLKEFKEKISEIGFSDLKNVLYFPQSPNQFKDILPNGTNSLLVQPISGTSNSDTTEMKDTSGFILLCSSSSYCYGEKDRAWISAIARKFRAMDFCSK